MRKIYFFSYLFIFLSLFIVSCSQDENEVISGDSKVLIEPDFFENDGSAGLEEERLEEEVPFEDVESASKTHYYNNYTLLKPSGLKQGDVNEIKCGETKSMPLLVGSRKKKVGTIKVSNDDENLYLTVKADEYKYLKKVYFYVGEKGNIPFYSNGFPNLYKFNYKAFPYYFGGQKKATYVIPLSSIDLDCFEIVAYAKVFDKKSWCFYSAFAYNPNLTQEYYYSYYSRCYYFKDWVRSFEYCKQDCDECIDVYSYKRLNPEHSTCFTDDGFDTLGWTNNFAFFWLKNPYRFQIYSNAADCDPTDDAVEIGHIDINTFTDDEGPKATLVYTITSDDYVLSEANLYVGLDKYPTNGSGQPSVDPADYNYNVTNLEDDATTSKTYSFTVPWPGLTDDRDAFDTYVIPHAKVCKVK